MNLISTFGGIGLLSLALAFVLSMQMPDTRKDTPNGKYYLSHSVIHKMNYEAAVRFWLIKILAGESGIMINVRIEPSCDQTTHIDDFDKGSYFDNMQIQGALTITKKKPY